MSEKNAITEGSIFSALWKFTLPLICAGLLQQTYSIVDTMIVGNFIGGNAVAALGATTSITNGASFITLGLMTGYSIQLSHLYGAGEHDKMQRLTSTAVIIMSVMIVFSAVLIVVGKDFIFNVLGTPVEIRDEAAEYLDTVAPGFIFPLLYSLYSGMIRALGDSRTTLYALIISSLLNVVLDLLFVPVFKMGIRGAALATVIAQAVSAAYMIIYISRKMEFMRVRFKKAYMDMVLFKECIRLSLPKIFQALAMSMGAMALQSVNNYFGVDAVASISTAYKIDSLSITPIMYMSSAVSIFTGQNLGAKKPERAKEGLRKGCAIAFSLSLLVSALLVFFGRDFLSLFGISQRSVELGGRFFLFCAFFYPVMGVYNAMTGFLQGLKDVAFVSFVSIFTMVIRIAVSFALRDVIGEDVIAVAECVNWTVGFFMCLIRVRGKERFLKASGKTH